MNLTTAFLVVMVPIVAYAGNGHGYRSDSLVSYLPIISIVCSILANTFQVEPDDRWIVKVVKRGINFAALNFSRKAGS